MIGLTTEIIGYILAYVHLIHTSYMSFSQKRLVIRFYVVPKLQKVCPELSFSWQHKSHIFFYVEQMSSTKLIGFKPQNVQCIEQEVCKMLDIHSLENDKETCC
jgi:hypothetical protein